MSLVRSLPRPDPPADDVRHFPLAGIRVKPYLTQIVSTILWRLNNKSAKVRQQAADLTSRLALVIKQCEEDTLLSKLGVVLFEQLGEEYPDTLGSIIAAIGAIANVVGMTQMSPPVKDLREYPPTAQLSLACTRV